MKQRDREKMSYNRPGDEYRIPYGDRSFAPVKAAEHPDPAKRRSREKQHFGTVDEHGHYQPPSGGLIPTRPTRKRK